MSSRNKEQLLNLDNAVVKLVELKKRLVEKIGINIKYYSEPLLKFLKDNELLGNEEKLENYEKLDSLFSLVWSIQIELENYKKTKDSSYIFENIEAYKIIFPYSEYKDPETYD